jgi:hypothetical protein
MSGNTDHENFLFNEFPSGYLPDINIQNNNVLGTDISL